MIGICSQSGERGYFVQPTVLTDKKPDISVVREEIFGPVVVAEPLGNTSSPAGGREMGHEVLELYSQTKAVVVVL